MAQTNAVVRPAATSWGAVLGGWIATLGILLSYLVGGYIAGRLAGYRTSWHGLMTAFFTLFILLLVLLLGVAADAGLFAGSGIRSRADILPGVRELNVASVGDALSFGAILSFLAASPGRLLPSVGRKGGERVAERHADEHVAADTGTRGREGGEVHITGD